MSDYIKREDALNTFSNAFYGGLAAKIKSIPPADVAPVRHGHWRLVSRLDELEWLYVAVIECSQCKHKWGAHYNYCPNCGAKMDEVKDDDKTD